MYNDSEPQTTPDIVKSLIQRMRPMLPEGVSEAHHVLLQDFKEAHREHFTSFMTALINQLGQIEDTSPSTFAEIEERINIFHFVLFEALAKIPYSVHTLPVDGLARNGLLVNIERLISQLGSSDTKVVQCQRLVAKLKMARTYDITELLNNTMELETGLDLNQIDACTDLLQLGQTSTPGTHTPQTQAFLEKYGEQLQDPVYCKNVIDQLLTQLDNMDQVDSLPLLKLEKQWLITNTLYFTLMNLCKDQSLYETRARILLLLNHHAALTFANATKIARDAKLEFGQHLGLISKIASSYKLLQDFDDELDTLYSLLLNNKAHLTYSKAFVDKLKNTIFDYFSNNANQNLMMAEHADQFESRAAARGYIQQVLNQLKKVKDHEKQLRLLRAKPKTEVDYLFKSIDWQSQLVLKSFQSNNVIGDLLSAFYVYIKNSTDMSLNALAVMSENMTKPSQPSSDLTSLAFASAIQEFQNSTTQTSSLVPPLTLIQIKIWNRHFFKVFKQLKELKLYTHPDEIRQLLPEVIQLLSALVNTMKAESLPIVIRASGEYIEKIKSRAIKINAEYTAKLNTTQPPAEEIAKPLQPSPVFVLNDKPLQEALEAIFSPQFDPKAPNYILSLLLSNENMTRQIIDRTLVRLIAEQVTEETEEFLVKSGLKINILIYFIDQILPKYPALSLQKYEVLGLLYSLSSLYISGVLKTFQATEEYNANNAEMYENLNHLYQKLEKLLPDFNDYIYYLKSSGQKSKIWQAHLDVLKYKIEYTNICLHIDDYTKAKQALEVAEVSLMEVNQAIDEIASVINISRHDLGHELVTVFGKRLHKASLITKNYMALAKPSMVVYQANGSMRVDNPDEQVNKIFQTFQNVPPDIHCQQYTHFAEQCQIFWQNFRFRSAMIFSIHSHCDKIIKNGCDSINSSTESKVKTILELQTTINGLFFVYFKLYPHHEKLFPTHEVTPNLQKSIMLTMSIQAKICRELLVSNELPFGSHAKFYEMLLRNHQMYEQHINAPFKAFLKSKLSTDINFVGLQYCSITDYALCLRDIAKLFADFTWEKKSDQLANDTLPLLKLIPELAPKLQIYKMDLYVHTPQKNSLHKLYDLFVTLTNKVTELEILLGQLSNGPLFLKRKEASNHLDEDLFASIEKCKDDPIELADIVLRMNNAIELPNIILALSNIRSHLKSFSVSKSISLHGISNLLAETVGRFDNQLEGTITSLNKELKKLQEREAKLIKEEVARFQLSIQRENKKATQRVKIVEDEPVPAPRAERKPAKPVVRERKSKVSSPLGLISTELSYEILAELDSKPDKLSKKAIRQQKKAMKKQFALTSEVIVVADQTPVVIEHAASETLQPASKGELNAKQLKKQRRKLREQIAQEESAALLLSLIEEIATLTLSQDKLTCIDEAYRVPEVFIERIPPLQKLLDLFVERNIKAYGYGGYPRDILLKRQHKDLDLVVFCSPATVREIFGEALRPHETLPNQFSLQGNIDIRCTEGTLLDFANGLDTTANALFVDANGHLYDPKAGYSNLFISDQLDTIGNTVQTFAEDPVRMYRLLRQSMELKKSIQEKDLLALKQHAAKLCLVNFSDFRKNFNSLFLNGKAEAQLDYLFKEKLLSSIFPQLKNANYSYLFVHYWLKMQCKRVDSNANRNNDYPFYRLVAIMLAPHCYNKCKASPFLAATVVHNVVVDFFANFTNYKPTKSEFSFLNEQLTLFCAVYKHDIDVQIERKQSKQIQQSPAPIVHQFRSHRKSITITIDDSESNFLDTMHIRILRRPNGIT